MDVRINFFQKYQESARSRNIRFKDGASFTPHSKRATHVKRSNHFRSYVGL